VVPAVVDGIHILRRADCAVPLLRAEPIRRVAAWIVLALQTLILLTGNYTFFNLLAIILTLFLFVEPKRAPMPGVRGAYIAR